MAKFCYMCLLITLSISGRYSLRSKIVGGQNALIQKYPYQVSVRFFGNHFCGGSILSKYLVVTAAHCFNNIEWLAHSGIGLTVVAGVTHLNASSLRGQTILVNETIIHPQYDAASFINDIAALRLGCTLQFNSNVQPIAISTDQTQIESEIVGVATGWGATIAEGRLSNTLQVVQLPVLPHSICVRAYKDEVISDAMFCAGYLQGGKDTCQGDSGGPLAFRGKLIGLVSWGYRCAEPGHPGIFTNVTKYLDFLCRYI